MKMGKVKRYDAFDGAPFSEKDSQETVKQSFVIDMRKTILSWNRPT
jgi:hypothetical protein